MFDFAEIEHFYRDEYFNSPKTQMAWFLYCYKFLTCVNGNWLKSVNPSNARNQVDMFLYLTVSDEALVRWVLELKVNKLLDEKIHGCPVGSVGKKKPNGMHDSRNFFYRYEEILEEVERRKSKIDPNQWNNLFWSIYRKREPKLFGNPSSVIRKFPIPDEDEDEPENLTKVTNIFNI